MPFRRAQAERRAKLYRGPGQLREILEIKHGSWYSLAFGCVKDRFDTDLEFEHKAP